MNPFPPESSSEPAVRGSGACPQCGARLAPDAPSGLCPKCLLRLGFDEGEEQQTGRYQPAFVAPLPEHLAPLFPQLRIDRRIGHGGMGVVYRAEQIQLGRPVALKILRPDLENDPTFAERFQREARTLARLQHPNIVTIFDFGRVGDLFYLTMEFVEGANLRHLERSGELTPDAALAIVPQICSALEYAHGEGVVHRDIKPENILINTAGVVKIADFGLAKMAGRVEDVTLTMQGQVMGTPHYMAPEQIERPGEVDHRADIYSLGVVLYEMLTGELPIGRFAMPSAKARIDVRLDQVVLRSLEKQPELRYQRVTEVSSDLQALNHPVHQRSDQRATEPSGMGVPPEVFGVDGLPLAARAMYWFAAIDGVMGLFFLLMTLEDNDWIVLALPALLASAVGMVTSSLLRHREYKTLAVAGSLLLLLPVPVVVVRPLVALWALVIVLVNRLPFSTPPIATSQTWLGIREWLIWLLPIAHRGLHRVAESAQRVRQEAQSVVSWSRVRMLAGQLLVAAAWTGACFAALLLIFAGWVESFAPVQVHLDDYSAVDLVNPFGIDEFSIVGTARFRRPEPSLNDEQFYERIRLTAEVTDRREPTARLDFDVATGEVAHGMHGWEQREPLSRELLKEWVFFAARRGGESLRESDPAVDRSIDDLHAMLQASRVQPLVIQEHGRSESLASPLASWLDSPHLYPRGERRGASRHSWTRSEDDAWGVAIGYMVSLWLLGLLVGFSPGLVQLYTGDRGEPGRQQRVVAIGWALAAMLACSLTALAAYAWFHWLPAAPWMPHFEHYYWFHHPVNEPQVATCVLALSAVSVLMLALIARTYFYRVSAFKVGTVGGLVWLIALISTGLLISRYPWWHYWPLLVPLWLTALSLIWIHAYARTAERLVASSESRIPAGEHGGGDVVSDAF